MYSRQQCIRRKHVYTGYSTEKKPVSLNIKADIIHNNIQTKIIQSKIAQSKFSDLTN